MAPAFVLMMIPGFIVFDLLPLLFKRKGLTEWYADKYNTDSDILLFVVYVPFFALCMWLLWHFSIYGQS